MSAALALTLVAQIAPPTPNVPLSSAPYKIKRLTEQIPRLRVNPRWAGIRFTPKAQLKQGEDSPSPLELRAKSGSAMTCCHVRCAPIRPDNTFVTSLAEYCCGEHRVFGKTIAGQREGGFGAVGYYETSYCATSSAFRSGRQTEQS